MRRDVPAPLHLSQVSPASIWVERMLTGSRQARRRVRGGYLGWEGDLEQGRGAVPVDGGAYPLLRGLFVWQLEMVHSNLNGTRANRGEAGEYFGLWRPGGGHLSGVHHASAPSQ